LRSQETDDLAKLFTSFIVKLDNVSIINDAAFLASVATALKKIWNLSEVFGTFKKTILATSSIQLPKSAHDTKLVLESVVGQVNCAMKYISHFVDASFAAPSSADLSADEKGIIDKAVSTIESWNTLCEQGVSIAMSNNPDIQYIKQTSDQLKNTTQTLITATNKLKNKLAGYNISGSSP
jgi:tetrahydromethanopterin S-methyltransferase subunit F